MNASLLKPENHLIRFVSSYAFSTAVPAVLGALGVYLAVTVNHEYGWTLFLGLPFAVGFLVGFCHGLRPERSFWHTYGLAIQSIFVLGVIVLVAALDGLICLLMAFPLAAFLALPGAYLGRLAAKSLRGCWTAVPPLVLIPLFPALVSFEQLRRSPPPERQVVTAVEVEGTPEEVWAMVVAFPKISDPPTGIFRLGIAYPIEARIEGEGIGAVRYCEFSTGPFVEPITRWEEPWILAFDVESSPLPMTEFTWYEHLDPPHLHGHLQSHRGQFVIQPLGGGRVRLEGTTWFSHDMWPQWYWGPISDHIIHHIHRRVLRHIKQQVETR